MKLTKIHSNNIEPHDIAIREYGKPSEKAVVMLHGFTHNGKLFEPLAKYLADKGLYVICPDMPGRGDSDNLENSKNYNYWLYIDDLFLILNYLKVTQVSLFGNSMGGIISVLFTEKYPKMVNKIVLNDIGIIAPSAESMRIGRHVGNDYTKKTKAEMIKRIDEEFLQSNLSNTELEFLFENYTVPAEDGFRFKYDKHLRDAFWFKDRQIKIPDLDFSENFSHLARICKSLELYVIRGKKSNLLDITNFEKMLNCSQYMGHFEVPNKGHLPLFFNDDEKDIILSWLK